MLNPSSSTLPPSIAFASTRSNPPSASLPRAHTLSLSSMGCSYSQLEADGETRSSLRRVQDQRRPMDGRVFKGSFVSTANLVPSECSEAGDDHDTTQQAQKSTSAHAASGAPNRAPKQVQEYEGKKKKKKAGSGPGLKDEGKGGKADEEEEFPGSPSFRFYTEGPWVNNDSADASGHGKDQEEKKKSNDNCLQKKRKCWVDCRLGRLMRKKENDLHQEDDSITSSREPECQSRREGDLKLYQRDPMLSLSPVLGGVDYFLGDQNKPGPEI
ncbi:unnamed protein product [Musa acuminata var. zebrina]